MTESQFLELLAPLENYLYWMALAITGNAEDAKDALQEGVISAFVSRGQLREVKAFKSWLKRIVAHECTRQLKRRSRVIPMGRSDESVFVKLAQPPEDHLLWQVVAKLPVPFAQVVTLHYAADLKQTEIAGMLGIPVGTVKSRLHKALSKLREELEVGKVGSTDEMSGR